MAEKRNIFQDVGGQAPTQTNPRGGLIDAGKTRARRGIRIWLHILLLLVASMIVLGGLTRLTDSGLSITEWKPVMGAVPPLNHAAWVGVFDKYQQTPEFKLQNSAMTLEQFKSIFWWEWSHRQLGRLIGLVWAVGFFWFLLRRKIPVGWTGRLVLIGGLGGLQGAIGWWMVSSGLRGRMVDVASYRLATHLGLAFIIMGLIAWFSMSLKRDEPGLMQARRNREGGLVAWATVLGLAAFAQILLGALVAGIDAGRSYTDWPWMDGQFLPAESFDYHPLWSNFFENPALVQFDHRMLGYTVFVLALLTWWRSRASALRASKRAFDWMLGAVSVQVALGITTVLYGAPVQIAIVHQVGAIVVIVMILRARFAAMYPAVQSLR